MEEIKSNKTLGTFDGVFVPTLLTILGTVMYLRLGWVVGNAGLLGALSIIVIAHIITLSTALSMSSMLTNIRIEDGGAYAIVSKSLGLEMGGAIGIPLYFSQALSVAFYIIGFVEVWQDFFPDHSVMMISLVTWTVLFIISYISAKLAFRVQYFILGAVALSLISFLLGDSINTTGHVMVGTFGDTSYWGTFAIFFPAVTGILTGVTMSGELKNPRKSIIKGTLGALVTGFFVYVGLAFWFSNLIPNDVLLTDTNIIITVSRFKVFIVLGIWGAVLSSALSTLVGAPRTLSSLAQNRSVPFSRFLSQKAKNGEPRNAIIVSSLISLVVLMTSNLDGLAELLTLFFLTTYGTINLIVVLEHVIGITSFRPLLSISVIIPIIGLFGCIFAMFLINKQFTFVTIIVIATIYWLLNKRKIVSEEGDVRGGIFTMVAEWAAQKSMKMPYHPKLWKPSILIPVADTESFKKVAPIINSIIYPAGRLYYLTINEGPERDVEECKKIDDVLQPLKDKELFANKVVINGGSFDEDFNIILQGLLSNFLPPNAVFFTISDNEAKRQKLKSIMTQIEHLEIGLMCMRIHPEKGLGNETRINLWLRGKSPNTNLAVLTALQLHRNWSGDLHLIRVVDDASQMDEVTEELSQFIDDARLPATTKADVLVGDFKTLLKDTPSDLTLLGMPPNYEDVFELSNVIPNSVMFLADSGLEDAIV